MSHEAMKELISALKDLTDKIQELDDWRQHHELRMRELEQKVIKMANNPPFSNGVNYCERKSN